jgi:hypothetical protein
MEEYFLSIRRYSVPFLAALLAMVGAGCSGGGEGGRPAASASLETGSLSKGQFIVRADAICKAARNQFNKEYVASYKKANPSSTDDERSWLEKMIETILLPNYEKRIDEIKSLGAPRGDKKEVGAFLDALQHRLQEFQEEPSELTKTAYPFKSVTKVAAAYGLKGCAESLG